MRVTGLEKAEEEGKVVVTYANRNSFVLQKDTFDAVLVTAPFGSVRLFGIFIIINDY